MFKKETIGKNIFRQITEYIKEKSFFPLIDGIYNRNEAPKKFSS